MTFLSFQAGGCKHIPKVLPDSHKGFRPDIEVDNKRLLLRELKIAQDNLLVEQQCSSILQS